MLGVRTRAAGGLESGDMPTRRTGRPACRAEGIGIRAAWLTGRHLAASRGNMRSGFSEPVKTARSECCQGSAGWWVSMANGVKVRAAHGHRLALFPSCARGNESPRTSAKHGSGQEEVAFGHTIGRVTPRRDDRRPDRLRGASPRQEGPVSLPDAERACGEPVKDSKKSSYPSCEDGCSTPRSPEHAAYGGSRDDPEHKPASSVDAVRVPH